jgi:hypothetical protein
MHKSMGKSVYHWDWNPLISFCLSEFYYIYHFYITSHVVFMSAMWFFSISKTVLRRNHSALIPEWFLENSILIFNNYCCVDYILEHPDLWMLNHIILSTCWNGGMFELYRKRECLTRECQEMDWETVKCTAKFYSTQQIQELPHRQGVWRRAVTGGDRKSVV